MKVRKQFFMLAEGEGPLLAFDLFRPRSREATRTMWTEEWLSSLARERSPAKLSKFRNSVRNSRSLSVSQNLPSDILAIMQDESHTCVRMDSHPQHVQQHPQAHLSPDTQLYPLCGQGPQSLSAVLSTANRKSTEQYQSTNRKSTEQYQSTNRKSTEQYQSTNRKSTERYQSGNSIENMEKLWGNEPKRSCTMADSVASMGLQGTGSANNTNGFVSTTSSSDINVQSIKPIMSEHLPDKSLNPSAYQRGNMLRRSVDSMQYNRKHNGYDGASILHGFLKYHESVGNASTTEQLDEKHSIQASTKPHFDASRPIGRPNQGPTTIKQLEEVHSNLSSPNPLFVATRPIGRPKRGPTTLEQVEEEHSNLSSPNPHYVASRPIGRPNQGPMTIKQQEEVHSNLSCTKPHFVATRPNGRPNRGPTTTEQVEEEHSNLSSSKPHFVGTRLNGRPNRGPMTTEQVEEEHSNQAPFKPQPSWSSSFGGPKRGFASTPLKKGGDTVLLAPYPLAENEMGEMVIESEGPSMRDDIIFKSAFFFFAEVVILLNFIVVLLMVTIFITLSHASQ
eukprot:gene11310-18946_t